MSSTPTPGGVEVRTGEGARYAVTGRAAVLIRWLAEHQNRINKIGKGCVTFDVAGTGVIPAVHEQYKRLTE